MSETSGPVKMLVIYRPKAGKAEELLELVKKHWPTLRSLGLSTDEPAIVYRATNKRSGKVFIVEIFSWKDGESSTRAHTAPEVMALWDPMGPIMDGMELAAIEPVSG
jgi:hypothetical protein